jgi:hypothetical protein
MIAQPEGMHLAEINVATAVDAMDSPRLAAFVAALDRVNAVAERSPGFVWRLKDDGGSAIDIRASDDPRLIVNVSVWETPEAFEQFVWNTIHKRFYARRAEWFETPASAHFAMWWVPVGHRPTLDESLEALARLERDGPGETVFGWAELPNVKLWMGQRCA